MVVSSCLETPVDFAAFLPLIVQESLLEGEPVLNLSLMEAEPFFNLSRVIGFLPFGFLACLFVLGSFIFALISFGRFYRCRNFLCRFCTLQLVRIHLCLWYLNLMTLGRIFERNLIAEASVAGCLGLGYCVFAVLLPEIKLCGIVLKS